MSLPYRTRRRLSHIGFTAAVLITVLLIVWLCSVIWLERYVVYTREGAVLDFDRQPQDVTGVVAVPPVAEHNVSIYYNEGTDAIDSGKELTPLSGYYISYDALSKDMAGVLENLKYPAPGTPIMIELKAGYGSFFYSSSLQDALPSASVDIQAVDNLIKELKSRGFYVIARVSAFRDYNFGLNHVTSGLYMLNRAGLWADDGGCYWMDPTNSTTLNWITNIVMELKSMGFHEVMLADFRFPASDRYLFSGDKDAALLAACNTLLASCQSDTFTLSFGVANADFPLPDGRSRIYLEGVDAKDVASRAEQAILADPEVRLVFLATTNDTRFDDYSVLRPLQVAAAWEAQKADMAALEEEE